MKKVLVTGSAGFIAGYLIPELLAHDWEVVGIDNDSKYGYQTKEFYAHPNYTHVIGDCKDYATMHSLVTDCDQVVAGAAMIGGISYFHEYPYDLMAENDRIIANTFDVCIKEFTTWSKPSRINVISSSMVYESTDTFPTLEGEQLICSPPLSTYGFQKLNTEYYAKGAWEQYKLPYTILRPFNCIGIGEGRTKNDKEIMSGNIKLAMSHVVPDLVQKVLKGQDPVHILGSGDQVRHYTYGGDIAKGIRMAMESKKAVNQDFNISTQYYYTVHGLLCTIWDIIHKRSEGKEFKVKHDKPYAYDVQYRSPDVSKARKLLGFEAKTVLVESLAEIIPWIRQQIDEGKL